MLPKTIVSIILLFVVEYNSGLYSSEWYPHQILCLLTFEEDNTIPTSNIVQRFQADENPTALHYSTCIRNPLPD